MEFAIIVISTMRDVVRAMKFLLFCLKSKLVFLFIVGVIDELKKLKLCWRIDGEMVEDCLFREWIFR